MEDDSKRLGEAIPKKIEKEAGVERLIKKQIIISTRTGDRREN
jgi:hypothetical protein